MRDISKAQKTVMKEAGPDIRDTQLAITQLLLRSGWQMTQSGHVVKKTKSPFQQTPNLYMLTPLDGGTLVVRDRGGRVVSKIVLQDGMSNEEIMNAAKILNNGAAQLRAAHSKDSNMSKIVKIAAVLREAAGLGHFGASDVKKLFSDGLRNSGQFHHEESGIKAKKVEIGGLPAGYELRHPNGTNLSFDDDELDTLGERASMWAERIQYKK